MNVHQTIQIHMVKIGAITNSSVFQIGTTGIITPASYVNNTGGFTEPAPPTTKLGTEIAEDLEEASFVPL